MKLQSKFTKKPSEMSYAVTVKDQCSSPFEDSDDESLFCNRATESREVTLRRIWINKRIIDKRNRWSKAERQSYVTFLKEEFDLMQREPQEHRKLRIYSLMEKYIGSKNYAQCRLHHQRMLKQYRDVERVIEECQRRLRGRLGRFDKMSQYLGLRVELEQEEEGNRTGDENEMWTVMQDNCWSYYQKEEVEEICSLN